MNISKETLEALKNFSEINQSLVLKEGQTQKTVALAKNILAEVTLKDTFPKTVGIYDLSELLSILSIMPDADVEFGETSMIISDGNMKTKFVYSDVSNIHPEVPDKNIDEIMPEHAVEFMLSANTLSSALKMSGVMALEDLQFTKVDGKLVLRVTDLSSSSSNSSDLEICDMDDTAEFSFNFKAERLEKLMADDYAVKISKNFVSRFVGQNLDSDYLISLEQSSMYED